MTSRTPRQLPPDTHPDDLLDNDEQQDTLAYLAEGAVVPPPQPKLMARTTSRRSLLAMGMAAIGATAWFGVPLNTEGAFFPGTQVNGLNIAELNRPQALATLKAHFADFENTAVDYVFEGQHWNASLGQLGYAIDYETTLDAAWQHGRAGSRISQFTGVMIGAEEKSYPVQFTRNEGKLFEFLSELGKQIVGASHDASLYLDGDQVRIKPDQDGRQLDMEAAMQATHKLVVAAERGEVQLNAVSVTSSITAADLEPRQALAQTLISRPVIVNTGDASWTVAQATLRAALVLPAEGVLADPALNEQVIEQTLSEMKIDVATKSSDAVLGWENGLIVVTPDVRGRELDVKGTVAAVAEAAKSSDNRTVDARFSEVLATVRADNMHELGIIDEIATGDSSYEGSSWERAENVKISAEHLTHTLVPPGGTYSFNQAIGPITLENGFVEGQIIVGSYIQSDIGGGACQASTTVFRAALLAGLPIQHHYHQYRLAFYEQDGWQPGLDAAIYQPNDPGDTNYEADLTFQNTTENWMLVEVVTDGLRVHCKLYGTPQGWDVKVEVPYVSEPKKPGKPIETEDPKLARGERKQVGWARDGYDVCATRTITQNGELVQQEGLSNPWEFWSYFQPQAETYLIGPGTQRQFDDKPNAENTPEG